MSMNSLTETAKAVTHRFTAVIQNDLQSKYEKRSSERLQIWRCSSSGSPETHPSSLKQNRWTDRWAVQKFFEFLTRCFVSNGAASLANPAEKERCINVVSYFDCEVSSEWASDSQDFFVCKFLVVHSGVLQIVLPGFIQDQLISYPLQSLTLHI